MRWPTAASIADADVDTRAGFQHREAQRRRPPDRGLAICRLFIPPCGALSPSGPLALSPSRLFADELVGLNSLGPRSVERPHTQFPSVSPPLPRAVYTGRQEHRVKATLCQATDHGVSQHGPQQQNCSTVVGMTVPSAELDASDDPCPTQQQHLSNELNRLNLFATQVQPPPKFDETPSHHAQRATGQQERERERENTDPKAINVPRPPPPLFSFSQVSNQNAKKAASQVRVRSS